MIITITWFVTGAGFCLAQEVSVKAINLVLAEDARFSQGDFQDLRQGKVVTKLLPKDDKREVAVFGITQFDAPVEIVEKSFRDVISRQAKTTSIQSGKFREPPVFGDIGKLQLEQKDLRALKNCRLRKCDVRLSAAMIDRFSSEIDWEKEDYRSAAEDLYQKLLTEYVQDYANRGPPALIEYGSKRETLSLSEEQNSLREKLFWIDRFTPELSRSIREFPKSQVTGLTNSFSWSKVKFGLKPVVIITHTATYKKSGNDASQTLIVSRQIYSSRYIDSSLSMTSVIGIVSNSGPEKTFLVFTNLTRASALGSRLGSLARNLVEQEAIGKLRTVLSETRRAASRAMVNQRQLPEPEPSDGIRVWFLQNGYIALWLSLFVLGAVALRRQIIRSRRK